MKLKAEIFDTLQYLFETTGFNDHQLHCVIRFKDKLDAAALEQAVRLLVKTVPMLSRVYRNAKGNSYWESVDPLQWKDLFSITDNEADFERFTSSKTNEETGPQIKVCLLQSKSDTISIILNHMVTDAAGMKQCIYLLSSFYSKLLYNPEYVPDFTIDGDRSFKKVMEGISWRHKVKILFHNKDNNQDTNTLFPMSNQGKASPFIVTHEILPEKYHEIRNFCRKHHVTLNDVILTAYFRVLSDMLDMNGKKLYIPIMIDMRRYLKDKSLHALTNLSSTVIISAAVQPGEDFYETLAKVSSEVNAKKSNFLGMNAFLKLSVLFKIFKRNFGYKILESSLRSPNICMTNIGALDSEKLIFEGSTIENAYVKGSIKYRPHFQLCISSFGSKMTFCASLYGNQQDQKNFSRFFRAMDSTLESLR